MDMRAEAERWLAADPDPATRAELAALLAMDDQDALADLFGSRLEFGTAGIRGPLGAGPNRMNRAVVRRVTAGVAAWLRASDPEAAARGVVVGRDARHGSDAFAEDVAGVLAGAKIPVYRFDWPVPTPLVAFAVRHLRASGGVQITASHNPPADNGYKLFGGDGAQIVPPADAAIARAADKVAAAADVPYSEDLALIRPVPARVRQVYVDTALALALHPECRRLRITYTPLHGVAGALCTELLARAGFGDVSTVPAQAAPDPDFPTLSFPNPEQPGTLDLALAHASDTGADLVIANDPDGDRIAAAVPTPSGGWRTLTGDEVGCLLADYLLAEGPDLDGRIVATTVVSSQMLAKVAVGYGVDYAETLTGFKWLARVAERGRLILAYEQALGVMVGEAVRDKDGMTAALVLAELAAWLGAQGRTLLDALDDLARRFGVHATTGWSVQLEGEQGERLVAETLAHLKGDPPSEVGGVAVGEMSLPAPDVVVLRLTDGSRLQVRPSGTEPLLKLYAEVVEPVRGDDVAAARARAASRLETLVVVFESLAFRR
jgi:phosphomannomutase